jgi:hypothetical protein
MVFHSLFHFTKVEDACKIHIYLIYSTLQRLPEGLIRKKKRKVNSQNTHYQHVPLVPFVPF